MPTMSAVVTGDVQGVGFRAYVQKQARHLGVTGEVWNRMDGSVELIAHHRDSVQLETLLRSLAGGPGSPESVEHGFVPTIGNYDSFSIAPTV